MKIPPVATAPKFSQMLIDLRAGLQAHADAAGEIIEIDYHLPSGGSIRMRFRPTDGADTSETPAAQPHTPTTPPQATPEVPTPAKVPKPLTKAERQALNSGFFGVLAEVLRSLPPEDIAHYLLKFPHDRILLRPR